MIGDKVLCTWKGTSPNGPEEGKVYTILEERLGLYCNHTKTDLWYKINDETQNEHSAGLFTPVDETYVKDCDTLLLLV